MFFPINNVHPLAVSVIEVGEEGYNDTFVQCQTVGNQQSEEKANTCNSFFFFLEILFFKKS